jgi:hypothetical protein
MCSFSNLFYLSPVSFVPFTHYFIIIIIIYFLCLPFCLSSLPSSVLCVFFLRVSLFPIPLTVQQCARCSCSQSRLNNWPLLPIANGGGADVTKVNNLMESVDTALNVYFKFLYSAFGKSLCTFKRCWK